VFERFTHPARTIVVLAQEEARRLGHRQITTPHLLLGLLRAAPDAASESLRTHGVSAEAVERELARLLTENPTADLDDAQILAALGIDVTRIREAVEASFGPGALDRAAKDADAGRRGLLARLTGGRLTRFPGRPLAPRDELAALRAGGRHPSGHIPFSPAAKKALELSLREAIRFGDRSIDTDHLTLGLLRAGDGGAAAVLDALGTDRAALRADLERRHRRSA
jgi:ATP-dependent Clp protease ATP-binding subunit ClpA